MIIGIPKEIVSGENRVSVTPGVAAKLIKLGYGIQIEKEAGSKANFTDSQYEGMGAKLVDSAEDLWATSDIIVKINTPTTTERQFLNKNKTLISLFFPGQH